MGNKKAVRKYINVFDAAKACVEILKNRYENKCVVLTGPKSIKISEVLEFLAKILNINSKIIFLRRTIMEKLLILMEKKGI